MGGTVLQRLRGRQEWALAAALPKADRPLAVAWWAVVLLHGLLPALFAVAMGVLVGAVQRGDSLAGPLSLVGVLFVLLQVLTPIQTAVSHNLGDRTAAWLYDRLTEACVRPPGLGHLEDAALATDLTVAREFDRGMTGPPLSYSMDFIAGGLVGMIGGLAAAAVLFGFAWWAPLVLAGAWLSTHWLLRESAVWFDRNTAEVRSAQRDAEYAYRLAVDPPASKELRLFGLVEWTIERFIGGRTRLHQLQYDATRLRERPLAAEPAPRRRRQRRRAVGAVCRRGRGPHRPGRARGLRAVRGRHVAHRVRRTQLGARRRLGAGGRRRPAGAGDGGGGTPRVGHAQRRGSAGARDSLPRRHLRLSGWRAGPRSASTSRSRPGRRWRSSGRTAPARPRWRSCCAGSTTRSAARSRWTASTCATSTWRRGDRAWPRCSRTSSASSSPLRDNVAPAGAPDEVVGEALAAAGGAGLAPLGTILARGYEGGTDLSGGQWQRVALARALAAVRMGAGVVLLDEPTAQLDVRGEAEIFERLLAATRHCTTILISHRFSTVRHADRICVLEQGTVVELGTHDELMALNGRYRTMFDLQAQRFGGEDEEGQSYDVLA